jgi:hypothetical protein
LKVVLHRLLCILTTGELDDDLANNVVGQEIGGQLVNKN